MAKKEHIAAALRIRTTNYKRYDDALYEFLKLFWPVVVTKPFDGNWHIKYLCQEIQDYLITIIEDMPINEKT